MDKSRVRRETDSAGKGEREGETPKHSVHVWRQAASKKKKRKHTIYTFGYLHDQNWRSKRNLLSITVIHVKSAKTHTHTEYTVMYIHAGIPISPWPFSHDKWILGLQGFTSIHAVLTILFRKRKIALSRQGRLGYTSPLILFPGATKVICLRCPRLVFWSF